MTVKTALTQPALEITYGGRNYGPGSVIELEGGSITFITKLNGLIPGYRYGLEVYLKNAKVETTDADYVNGTLIPFSSKVLLAISGEVERSKRANPLISLMAGRKRLAVVYYVTATNATLSAPTPARTSNSLPLAPMAVIASAVGVATALLLARRRRPKVVEEPYGEIFP